MADLSMSTIRRYLDEMGFSDLSDDQVRMLRRDVIARLQDTEDAAVEVDFEAQEAQKVGKSGKIRKTAGNARQAAYEGKSGAAPGNTERAAKISKAAPRLTGAGKEADYDGSDDDNARNWRGGAVDAQEDHESQESQEKQFMRDFAEGNVENLLGAAGMTGVTGAAGITGVAGADGIDDADDADYMISAANAAGKRRARQGGASKNAFYNAPAAHSRTRQATAEIAGSDEERLARMYGGGAESFSSASEEVPEFTRGRPGAYSGHGGQRGYGGQGRQGGQGGQGGENGQNGLKTRPAGRKPSSAISGVSGVSAGSGINTASADGRRRGRVVGVAGPARSAKSGESVGAVKAAPVRTAQADLLRDEHAYDADADADLDAGSGSGDSARERDERARYGRKQPQNPFLRPAEEDFEGARSDSLAGYAYAQTMRTTGHTRINGLLGPHRYTLEEKKRRKADPVSNFAAYQQRWRVQGPPEERRQRTFGNRVREQGACYGASQRYYE